MFCSVSSLTYVLYLPSRIGLELLGGGGHVRERHVHVELDGVKQLHHHVGHVLEGKFPARSRTKAHTR